MKAKKNPAAVALARRSAESRMKTLTAAQRSEQARRAAASRWGKTKAGTLNDAKPTRWFGLVAVDDPNEPEVLMWSHNKTEVRERGKKEWASHGCTFIIDVDYDPTRFNILREFVPDVTSQAKALKTLLIATDGESK